MIGALGVGAVIDGARRNLFALIGVVMTIALLGAIAWGWRVDTLRGRYLAELQSVMTAIEPMFGRKVKLDQVAIGTTVVVARYEKRRAELAVALATMKRQSESIDRLGEEGRQARARAEANLKLAEATIAQREIWRARAAAAATRTERRSAELELEECNAVLDALYRDGF